MSTDRIRIEVALALPHHQQVTAMQVNAGTTAREAVLTSGLAEQFPDIDVRAATLGIFGHTLTEPEQHRLSDGDRVEIYRPLLLDPKEARRQRARQKRVSPDQGETG